MSELPILRDDAHLAELVMAAAEREIAADYQKNVGEELEPGLYVSQVLSFAGDDLEMIVTCYSQHTGYGGGGYYFTVYANSYGWGLDAPDTLQMKHIVSYLEGECYTPIISDPSVRYQVSS